MLRDSSRNKKAMSSTDQGARSSAYQDPSAIQRYLDEEDRYKAFLAGQRQDEDGKREAISLELPDWNKVWDSHSGKRDSKHGRPYPKSLLK